METLFSPEKPDLNPMDKDKEDKKPKKKRPPNPTGKGGFRERPELQSKGPEAKSEKKAEAKRQEAVYYEFYINAIRQRKLDLALLSEHLPTALKACDSIELIVKESQNGGSTENEQLELAKDEYYLAKDEYYKERKRRMELEEKVTKMEQEMAELRGQDGLKISRLGQ